MKIRYVLMSTLSMGFFMLLTTNIYSQEYQFTQNYINELDEYIEYANIERNSATIPTYENVKGSPFLNRDFVEGQVKLDNGRTYKGPLRYDIYTDEIEFKTSNGDIYAVKNPENIQFIVLGDLNFIYFEPGEMTEVKGFYQLMVIGDYSLYKKYNVFLKDPEAARPYTDAKPAVFEIQDSDYFISDLEGVFTQIRNRKDMLKLDNNSTQLESFIKSNKIKHKDEEDLIRLVSFLNQQ